MGVLLSARLIAIAFLLSALGACASPPPPIMAPPPPVAMLSPDAACLRDLAATQATFQALGSFGEGHCSIANPVRMSGGAVPWNRSGIISCPMARTLARFEAEVIQPLARKYFGQPVRRLDHYGTYDCRAQRTESSEAAAKQGTSKGGRLSEHATGRAIDFAGIELADGRVISVKRDWRAGGANGAFLHELAKASCQTFNVVLTPNHDRLHQDHIHLDIGPHTLCGY